MIETTATIVKTRFRRAYYGYWALSIGTLDSGQMEISLNPDIVIHVQMTAEKHNLVEHN